MLNCFLNIDKFTNNASLINPIGELSAIGMTYSREVDTYSAPNVNSDLLVFDYGTLSTNQSAAIKPAAVAIATALNNIVGYNTSSGTILNNVVAALGGNASNVSIGDLVVNPVDGLQYPKWIVFTFQTNNQSYDLKVWLNNDDFIANYPLGNITLVFPVTNLLDLYNNFSTASTEIQNLKATDLINKLYSTPVNYAYTGMSDLSFRVYNRNNSSQFFDLPILVAYNGGSIFCNAVNYFNTFVDELLAMGTMTINDWATVIPGLIPTNKYYIMANWNNTAIVNGAVPSPILSPTLSIKTGNNIANDIAVNVFPSYTGDQVWNYLDYTILTYKSIGLFILPDIGNYDGRLDWSHKFTDYFVVSLSDINVQQMSVNTQSVISLLTDLIKFCETYTSTTVLPSNYIKETKGNYNFINSTINNITLSVLTRESGIAHPFN